MYVVVKVILEGILLLAAPIGGAALAVNGGAIFIKIVIGIGGAHVEHDMPHDMPHHDQPGHNNKMAPNCSPPPIKTPFTNSGRK